MGLVEDSRRAEAAHALQPHTMHCLSPATLVPGRKVDLVWPRHVDTIADCPSDLVVLDAVWGIGELNIEYPSQAKGEHIRHEGRAYGCPGSPWGHAYGDVVPYLVQSCSR